MPLTIRNLTIKVKAKTIVKNFNLQIEKKETQVLMGPNGSGKSSLAYALAGHPDYQIAASQNTALKIDGRNLLTLSVDERARAGLFLAFQTPQTVNGIKIKRFLWEVYRQRFGQSGIDNILDFYEYLQTVAVELGLPVDALNRGLNAGLSGGEKKKMEILQLQVLRPQYVILDEIDSGLDLDAIKLIAAKIKKLQQKHQFGLLVITHYPRLLQFIHPDRLHIMKAGKIVASGSDELLKRIEEKGYESF